jgi:hypothetical protein
MKEVLILKGFPERWVEWVMQAVVGECVLMLTLNKGGFLATFKGLR